MKSIIVFGDSITFGRGDNEYKEGWVGRLRKFVKSKDGYWCLFNLGIPSGETVSDVIKRIKTESLSRFKAKYDDDELFIILNIGLNDSKLNGNKPITPIPKFQKEVQDLITISKKLTDKIIWIGPMPVNEKSVFKTFETYLFKNSSIKKYNELLKIGKDRINTMVERQNEKLQKQIKIIYQYLLFWFS